MTSDSPLDLTELIHSYIYVEIKPGSYCGWKESLLKGKLYDAEIITMLCGHCLGVVRGACVYTQEDKKNDSLRCENCLPEGVEIVPVYFVRKAIEHKKATCPFPDCKWSESITLLEDHLYKECTELLVPCPLKCWSEGYDQSKITLLKKPHVEEHCKNECPKLFARCEACNLKFKVKKIENHTENCDYVLVPCPNECKDQSETVTLLMRKEVKLHTFRDCPQEKVNCSYYEEGCLEAIYRVDMEMHEFDFIHKHMKLLTECFRKQSKENIQLKSKVNELESSTNNPIVGMTEMKIEGVAQKLENKEEIESPPFFVGHYKFQLGIQWDCGGDGNIGCYVSILKGNWDDSLAWPVRYKFKFIILNQNKKHDYVRSGEISENEMKDSSAIFHKPQGERNVGYGLKKFITCEECCRARHTLNDSLTFRAMIEIIPFRSDLVV